MSKQEYVYEVEEYSQDTRHYEVTSNVKLTEYELQQIAITMLTAGLLANSKLMINTNDLQKYISWEDKRFSDDEIENKVKVSVKFNGTEYGDDCQVDTTGEFEEI